MNVDLVWSKFLEKIKLEVNSIVYKTWFEGTKLYSLQDGIATIIVPMDIHRRHINDYYRKLIIQNLYLITNETYELSFILNDEVVNIENSVVNIELSTPEVKIESTNYIHSSNLIKSYNFENFVVGNSNKLAHATALAVAETPGQTYNPLFIYGSSGLGKTHLMHAIGNYIEEKSNKRVLYISSQQFIDDFVKLGRDKNNYEYAEYFKNKYRSLDVLIIDDIQFFSTTPKTQEEFFHIFNILYNDKKQIIISSDRSPNDLKSLEERLKTRFCWGLTVDIYPPELELRKNILRKKIQSSNILPEISEEVIDYIAANMTSDVRNLEGAINRLMAYSLMMGYNEINLPVAVEALKDIINKGTSEKANILKVQKAVADHFQISVDDLKSKKRSASIAFPRQIAMYLSRIILNESFERIGLEFGGKDHSTVMHSCDKIKTEVETNNEIKNTIDKIKENII
jgi:chromosomal replication initiator protein